MKCLCCEVELKYAATCLKCGTPAPKIVRFSKRPVPESVKHYSRSYPDTRMAQQLRKAGF